ncbi:type I-F CRISPR-associated protein Csy1 [Snodgrassella sp. CFCC 13594]|uniref:type I-F CRISPR-associated protein Csy1 n=1 Tax=Snodgrassella sp. CFCC 13594 TaxID=1775559 RepID=UPI000836D108|nr:type I-F CRISPR-associated protein Csy1 [Snodgrassella sp. CFCC 13594]
MTQAIHAFLAERQDNWLKAKLKGITDETEIADIQQQASEKFSLAQWVPDAARRAGQLTIVSHPGKFSHPRAQISDIIAPSLPMTDGFIRSGNVSLALDIIGSAAAIDAYKFLSLKLKDKKTILEHLDADTAYIQQVLKLPKSIYQTTRLNFLKIKSSNLEKQTHNLIKQIYFPINNNEYHLLSVLTPSGLLSELKERIRTMRFSDKAKAARLNFKHHLFDETGFDDIYGLSIIAYGSANPQGISVLNSSNSGKYYLLPCLPPELQQRNIRIPHRDFFQQCLYPSTFVNNFQFLHHKMKDSRNNWQNRNEIRDVISFIIDRILSLSLLIRHDPNLPQNWSTADNCILPNAQKIWLDAARAPEREQNDEWRDHIATDLAHWFIKTYQKILSNKAFLLADGELIAIKQAVLSALEKDKENF